MFVATHLGVLILILERSKAGSVAVSTNLSIPADHEAERLNKCLDLSMEKLWSRLNHSTSSRESDLIVSIYD
jgi:hypothetical protein